jgi:Mg/Co/Ni transporter MgtE
MYLKEYNYIKIYASKKTVNPIIVSVPIITAVLNISSFLILFVIIELLANLYPFY